MGDTFQTPSKHLPDTFKTPSRHLPDTLPTPSRHPLDTPQISSRHPLDTNKTPSKFQLLIFYGSKRIVTTPTQPQLNSKVGCDMKMTLIHHHHPPPPTTTTTTTRYLLRGAKFKFLVKTKKFLGGEGPMGAKPKGAIRPQGGRRPPQYGLGRRPT